MYFGDPFWGSAEFSTVWIEYKKHVCRREFDTMIATWEIYFSSNTVRYSMQYVRTGMYSKVDKNTEGGGNMQYRYSLKYGVPI